MHGTAHKLCFFALVGVMVSLAYAINYQYFSDQELTVFGDRVKFWHEDTCAGPVRSNGQIAIMENPMFYDFVITTAEEFWHGAGYNPGFFHPEYPVFNAPELPFPENATMIRQRAFDQGFYFNAGPNMQAWVRIRHDTLRVTWAEFGEPFDSLNYEDVLLPDSAVVFFEAALRLSGQVSTTLILGASGRIGLEDNIYYASTDYFPPVPPPQSHPEKFTLISENEIKILNTPQNGRGNSNGLGQGQENPDFTDIVLHGIYVALNESFTFDQQNDPDSGYVCACQPDERGTIWLYGSLMQMRRGYVHRSNNTGTGYAKHYRYDNDLRHWNIHLWSDTLRENLVTPSQLDFGNVMVGATAWDTVRVYNDFVPVSISSLSTEWGDFSPFELDTTLDWEHEIIVAFHPYDPMPFQDTLRFTIDYYGQTFAVPLTGTATANATDDDFILHPFAFSLSAYPNPFNSRATFTISLPSSGLVELKLYDVQGREAATVFDQVTSPGVQQVTFDAGDLPSGIYFARLRTPTAVTSNKLLLIK